MSAKVPQGSPWALVLPWRQGTSVQRCPKKAVPQAAEVKHCPDTLPVYFTRSNTVCEYVHVPHHHLVSWLKDPRLHSPSWLYMLDIWNDFAITARDDFISPPSRWWQVLSSLQRWTSVARTGRLFLPSSCSIIPAWFQPLSAEGLQEKFSQSSITWINVFHVPVGSCRFVKEIFFLFQNSTRSFLCRCSPLLFTVLPTNPRQ